MEMAEGKAKKPRHCQIKILFATFKVDFLSRTTYIIFFFQLDPDPSSV